MLVASLTTFQEPPLEADLIEWRLDYLGTVPKPTRPSIFTFRKKSQGGALELSEEERLRRLEKALELGPTYCDIEADTDPLWIARMAQKFTNVKWIGSYHNFEKTPEDLEALLRSMANPHFSIYKIAVKANSSTDMLRLMCFTKEAHVPIAAISMGEYGRPSRILGKVYGNALNYAGIDDDPFLGRYSLKTLLETFRFKTLNRDTKVYALLGDPIEQSVGHLFHNARFERNAVYVKIRVSKEELLDCFVSVRRLGFAGLSITMPLKEAILPLLNTYDAPEAVNTVVFDRGKALGFNTDGIGALDAIEKHMLVAGKRIALLGAGGTAKAIVFEAKKRGASVAIYNRTVEKAKELGEGYSLAELKEYDILINTVAVTLDIALRQGKWVMDVVYTPKETPLLQEASRLGCRCIYGEEMFITQASLQQKMWKNFQE